MMKPKQLIDAHKQLIDALGGPVAVAEELGIGNYRVVSNWCRRGISWAWRAPVAKLARKRRLELPERFLEPAAAERAA